ESTLKYLVIIFLIFVSPLAYSKTVSSVAIAPQGAALQNGSNLQFSATCTYSDSSTDNCAAAGGISWSTSKSALKVSATGMATAASDPSAGTANGGLVIASAGGVSDRAEVYIQ